MMFEQRVPRDGQAGSQAAAAARGAGHATYRADIDGLRAVAVLLVVASHLHVAHFGGGYVGVDVFFVISGYLISSNILPLIRSGTFSLSAFYVRRVRRIFPALIVMLAVTVPLAWHFLFPTEMVEYARSLAAAVFACSNTLLWNWGGYFATENDLKPLLHTWSLGVEEQFYLLFPLCLLALTRLRRYGWITGFIWGVAAASFAGAWFFTSRNPHAAFFSVGLRAWELMVGTILSQHSVPTPRRRVVREVVGAIGLVLIVAAGMMYSAQTAFPGLAALPPCMGAAMVIAAGERGSSLAGRLLSWRPMVFVGLISYSLYLWHWPVEVFFNLRHVRVCEPGACASPLSGSTQVCVFLISVAIASLSWYFVETPFRRGRGGIATRRVLMMSGSAAGLVAACAVMMMATKGMPSRFPPDAVMAASQLSFDTYVPWRWGSCALGLDQTSAEMYDRARCLPFTAGKRHYLLLGDSHAAHLWPGFSAVYGDREIGQANVAGCDLLQDKQADASSTCRGMANYIYDDLLPSGQVDTLIVSAQWRGSDLAGIERLVEYARRAGIGVVLIGPNVAYDLPLPRLLANLSARGGDVGVVQSHAVPGAVRLDAQLEELARDKWKVGYVSYFGDVCGTGGCPAYASDGVPMLLDSNHFSPEGAIRFVTAMRDRGQIP